MFEKISLGLKLKKTNKNKQEVKKIAVIGGGSWATALVKILSENLVQVHWWMRNRETLHYIQKYRHNPKYLSDVPIHKKKVKTQEEIHKAVNEAEIILLAVPAAFVRETLQGFVAGEFNNKIIVSAIKGIIPEQNLLVTEYMQEFFRVLPQQLAVISGPCHAEEVALEKQSYLTVCSEYAETAQLIAELLTCRFIKSASNSDVLGVEYSAVIKNIIALACGITHGLNYGDNFQAVLVSNAMQEISRFLDRVSPCARDMNASAYLGDLLVTAYSQFSRNRMFGNMVGRGYTVQSAQIEMNMIAEGYYAVKSIYEINKKYMVDMPITKAVYKILYEKVSPALEISILRDQLK